MAEFAAILRLVVSNLSQIPHPLICEILLKPWASPRTPASLTFTILPHAQGKLPCKSFLEDHILSGLFWSLKLTWLFNLEHSAQCSGFCQNPNVSWNPSWAEDTSLARPPAPFKFTLSISGYLRHAFTLGTEVKAWKVEVSLAAWLAGSNLESFPFHAGNSASATCNCDLWPWLFQSTVKVNKLVRKGFTGLRM